MTKLGRAIMADDSEVPEIQGSTGRSQTTSVSLHAPLPSPSGLAGAFPLDISSFTHTPCYCEENVYMLCKNLCKVGVADQMGTDLFVVFISNEEKMVPLWHQKASKRNDGMILWDYHVICIQRRRGKVFDFVWDLDSNLPFPSPLNMYFSEAIRPMNPPDLAITRLFRVVHAPIFLRCFASDRSHMKDALGNLLALPPDHEPITAVDGTKNNLDKYIQMREADTLSILDDLTHGVFSNEYGVVVTETMLEWFFSQIHQ
ncbi:protein N-terminal glutamine amidohydrolase isoform X2 [Canna indica]|uniref:Protein N-terminal glutamine amidohydrolase n=1 Tax=Canna indica TaxID=4628 RepID=A0AAQ3Q566_9LILI|nr:protein N-terminal glutamine amidohydrolase isoform X2 [Canna indica]